MRSANKIHVSYKFASPRLEQRWELNGAQRLVLRKSDSRSKDILIRPNCDSIGFDGEIMQTNVHSNDAGRRA